MDKNVPTMKNTKETAKHFNLPRNFVRRAVLDGKVVYVKSGSKYLINIEKFEQWLNTGEQTTNPELEHGNIRQLR